MPAVSPIVEAAKNIQRCKAIMKKRGDLTHLKKSFNCTPLDEKFLSPKERDALSNKAKKLTKEMQDKIKSLEMWENLFGKKVNVSPKGTKKATGGTGDVFISSHEDYIRVKKQRNN